MTLRYAGSYSDGRTAARHRVTVRFADDRLVVEADDGEAISEWPYAKLAFASPPRRGAPVRLANAAREGARLTLDDPAALHPLYACAPQLRRRGALGRRPWLVAAAWAGGVAAVAALLVLGLPRLAEPVAALVPHEWEDALGAQAADGFFRERKECTAPEGARALDRLTRRLAAATGDAPYDFTVRVADVPAVNAFAAPGGHIVLFRGLIDGARGPGEVAGVLAHEMGHVIERHGTEAMVRATGLALLLELLVGDVGGVLALGAELGGTLLTLSYSRRDEAEADRVAVRLLATAGIGADGLARFLESLGRGETAGGVDLGFLSTHPASAERAEAVRAAAAPGGRALEPAEWRALRAICG